MAACAPTVDGIINAAATAGCLPGIHTGIVDTLIDDEYGRALTSVETTQRLRCAQDFGLSSRCTSLVMRARCRTGR